MTALFAYCLLASGVILLASVVVSVLFDAIVRRRLARRYERVRQRDALRAEREATLIASLFASGVSVHSVRFRYESAIAYDPTYDVVVDVSNMKRGEKSK
jgi:hypothetical protein